MFAPEEYEEVSEMASFYTMEKIETLIRTSSLDRCKMFERLEKVVSESEAMELYNYIKGNQLIPGYHYTPHSVVDQGLAIRFMVSKDDLHELRFKHGTQVSQ